MTWTYVGVIVVPGALPRHAACLLRDLKNERVAALLDPFGIGAVRHRRPILDGRGPQHDDAAARRPGARNRVLWFAVAFALFGVRLLALSLRGARRRTRSGASARKRGAGRRRGCRVTSAPPLRRRERLARASLEVRRASRWRRCSEPGLLRPAPLGIVNAGRPLWLPAFRSTNGRCPGDARR